MFLFFSDINWAPFESGFVIVIVKLLELLTALHPDKEPARNILRQIKRV